MINKPVRLFILLLLLCSVFTCRYLPFDKELELAAATLPKLTLEATIGPVQVQSWCVSNNTSDKFFFMPDKDNFSTGFMLRSSPNGNIDIRYLYSDGIMSNNTLSYHINGTTPYKPNGLIETISGVTGKLLVILYDNTEIDQIPSCRIIIALPGPNLSESLLINDLNSYIPGSDRINGAFIKPEKPSPDKLYFLYTDTLNKFQEVYFSISGSGIVTLTPSRATPVNYLNQDPYWPNDLFYAFDPLTSMSFISYSLSDGFHNVWWNSTEKKGFADKYPRIGILNNGDLLSMDKGVMYGFNQSGNQLYKFPLGELKYMYETYSMTRDEYLMVFVLTQITMNDQYGDCNPYFTYRIYSYPSEDVAKLNF
jgi:hypothetical protein